MNRYKPYAWPMLTLVVLFAFVTLTLLELVFPQEAAGVHTRLSAPEVRTGYYVMVLLLVTSLAISLVNADAEMTDRKTITCKLFLLVLLLVPVAVFAPGIEGVALLVAVFVVGGSLLFLWPAPTER